MRVVSSSLRCFVLVLALGAVGAAPVVAAPAPLVPGERQSFLGFHKDGDLHYLQIEPVPAGAAFVRVCRADVSELPRAWPEKVVLGPGVRCGTLDTDATGAVAPLLFVKSDTAHAKTAKTSPWGIPVTLEEDETGFALLATDETDREVRLPLGDAPSKLRIAEVVWRADGRVAAVAVEPVAAAATKDKKTRHFRTVVLIDVSPLLLGGQAGRKLALAREKEAQALLKQRQWSEAGRLLDEAIAADPGYLPVRLLRAAAEAQGGIGRSAMIENLEHLKKLADAGDTTAVRLLQAAAKDRAFDAWCGEPEVRELLGLPQVGGLDAEERLLERSATWTLAGSTCKSPWVTLLFLRGGKGTLEVASSCKGKKTRQKQPFAWAAGKGGRIALTTRPLEVDGVKVPAEAVVALDGSLQQFRLEVGEELLPGNYEPGQANLDDSL
jgi:hypothetical protein